MSTSESSRSARFRSATDGSGGLTVIQNSLVDLDVEGVLDSEEASDLGLGGVDCSAGVGDGVPSLPSLPLPSPASRVIAVMNSGMKPVELAFDGKNTSSFLRKYDLIMDSERTSDSDRCHRLPLHLPEDYSRLVYDWKEWKTRNWKETRERMLDEFYDEEKNKYVPSDLHKIALKALDSGLKTSRSLLAYHRKFCLASRELKKREIISWQEESKAFLEGIPSKLRTRWENENRRSRKDEKRLLEVAHKARNSDLPSGASILSEIEKESLARKSRRNRDVYQKLPEVQAIFDLLIEILEDDEIYRREKGKSSKKETFNGFDSSSSSGDSSSDSSSSSASEQTCKSSSRRSSRSQEPRESSKSKKKSEPVPLRAEYESSATMANILQGFNDMRIQMAEIVSRASPVPHQPPRGAGLYSSLPGTF
ncbi:hypothetical protein P7C70_g9234, partial [Phenoliferia sp. Uapishka_3]